MGPASIDGENKSGKLCFWFIFLPDTTYHDNNNNNNNEKKQKYKYNTTRLFLTNINKTHENMKRFDIHDYNIFLLIDVS